MIMLLQIFLSAALAKDLPGEEIYSAPVKPESAAASPSSPDPKSLLQNGRSRGATEASGGGVRSEYAAQRARRSNDGSGHLEKDSNLPQAYSAGSRRQSTASELIQPPKGSSEVLRALKVGDKLQATIYHSIIAFPDERAPVVATINSKNVRNIKLIGESRLEKNSKRIFIEFTRAVQNGKIYQLKASGLTDIGVPGFEGEYHSKEAEYFSGDFIASFVAGYFDGLVPRRTNAFGQTESDNSVDSALKKGMAAGSMSSAERFREKLKHTPEFSELQGAIDLTVLILEEPRSN